MSGPLPVVVAHGIGTRGDLPLPVWLFAYGAGAALVISFALLRLLWHRPRLDAAAAGTPAPSWTSAGVGALAALGRVVGLASFALVVAAGAFGNDAPTENIAPVALYVVFWVGLQCAAPVVGDVWRALSPWDTIALLVARVRGRRTSAAPAPREGATHWPAAAGAAAFAWLELAYHAPASPRVVAVAVVVYAVVMLACAARWGRAWLRTGDGFAVWFGLLAAMSPLHVEGGGVEGGGVEDDGERHAGRGRLRLRWPGAGLANIVVRPGTPAVVLVVLGATAFDGLTRTGFWNGIVAGRTGWALTVAATAGLAWTIALMALGYVVAMHVGASLSGRRGDGLVAPFVHSLVPIALAYAVAHYFSLFVFDGQGAISLLSDPLGRGWDLLGTADWRVDYRAVTPATIAWVQAGAIVVGHVLGVVVAHDRAVELFDRRQADRSQRPLLAVMVAYTVGGLGLLLGA